MTTQEHFHQTASLCAVACYSPVASWQGSSSPTSTFPSAQLRSEDNRSGVPDKRLSPVLPDLERSSLHQSTMGVIGAEWDFLTSVLMLDDGDGLRMKPGRKQKGPQGAPPNRSADRPRVRMEATEVWNSDCTDQLFVHIGFPPSEFVGAVDPSWLGTGLII